MKRWSLGLVLTLALHGCVVVTFDEDAAVEDAAIADGGRDADLSDAGLDASADGGAFFVPGPEEPTGPRSWERAVWIDFDGDGDDDVLFAGGGATAPRVALFRVEGDALALDPSFPDEDAPVVDALAVGDIDGDGREDLVVAEPAGVRLVPNAGPPEHLDQAGARRLRDDCDGAPGPATVRALAIGDVDLDGDLDLVVAEDDATVILRNDGATFGCGPRLPGGALAARVLVLDAGRVAVVLGGHGFASAHVVEGGTDGREIWSVPGAPAVRAMATGDVDGDGDLDLALAVDGSDLIFANVDGHLEALPVHRDPDDAATRSVDLADVDGDGRADLARGMEDGTVRIDRSVPGGLAPIFEGAGGGPTRVAFGRPDASRAPALALATDADTSGARLLSPSDSLPAECPDRDGDGHRDVACGGDDCDDRAPTVFPGASPICGNGVVESCGGDLAALRTHVFGGDVGEVSVLAPTTVIASSEVPSGRLGVPVGVTIGGRGVAYVTYVHGEGDGASAELAFVTPGRPGRRLRTVEAADADLAGATLRDVRDVAIRYGGDPAPDTIAWQLVATASDDADVFGYACRHDEAGDARECTRLRGMPALPTVTELAGGTGSIPLRRYFLDAAGQLGSTDEEGGLGSYTFVDLGAEARGPIAGSGGDRVAVALGTSDVAIHRGGTSDFDRLAAADRIDGGIALGAVSDDAFVLAYTVEGTTRLRRVSCAPTCGFGSDPTEEPPPLVGTSRPLMTMSEISGTMFVLGAVRRTDGEEAIVARLAAFADLAPVGAAEEIPLVEALAPGDVAALRIATRYAGSAGDRELTVLVAYTVGSDALERSVRVGGLRLCERP
ncbi:MAG: FG-GAP-like repeat-containing protein [Sandaracinaceae bacterium]